MWWLDKNSWLPKWVDATSDDDQRLKMDIVPDDHKEMDAIDLTIAVCGWYNIFTISCAWVYVHVCGMPQESIIVMRVVLHG